jgi:outer membrane protein assembly factor BamB/orotate phosphoribosyltransferase
MNAIAEITVEPGPRERARPGLHAPSLEMLRRAVLDRVMHLGAAPSFDFKELLTNNRLVHAAGRLLWELVRGFEPEVLVGPGFGGAPLLVATALAAWERDGVELGTWMVRDQRKTYYGKRWIEGPRFAHAPRAVMLDDFLGRGSAVELLDLALASEQLQARLCAIAVVLDYWSPLGSRQLGVSRCPVVSLFKRHDLGLTRDCHDARPPSMTGEAPPLLARQAWWRLEFNGAHDYPLKSAPVIADDAVFAADDRARVWRFDAATGEARWCRASLGSHPKGIVQRLQHVDGSIVYGGYDGTVTRLDAERGEIVWRWRVDSAVHASPVVDLARRRLFVNTEAIDDRGEPGGHLVALDWDSGRVLWRHRHAFWAPATVCHDAARDVVVAPCNDESLTCVDADTGTPRWSARTTGLVRGQPAIDSGKLIAATESGWLEAFDLDTGAALHRRRYGSGGFHQFTLAEDGVVYTLDDGAHVCAFDTSDFRLRWIGKLRSPGAWTPVRCGQHLVVLSEAGHLAVFDAAGLKLWEGSVGRGEYRQPPALGWAAGRPMLACASNGSGLKAFHIDPYYCTPTPT